MIAGLSNTIKAVALLAYAEAMSPGILRAVASTYSAKPAPAAQQAKPEHAPAIKAGCMLLLRRAGLTRRVLLNERTPGLFPRWVCVESEVVDWLTLGSWAFLIGAAVAAIVAVVRAFAS